MLRRIKKSVAVILVAAFLMTMFAIAPSASEKKDGSSAGSTEYSVSGTNSAGDLLADEIENYRAQQNETEGSYVISDIKVSGNIATVNYSAQADCTVLVALYDENTDAMLASGKTEVKGNETSVDVTIETENMPTAFVVKGFMLDSNNDPLSALFSSVMYTTKMQDLANMTVNDFESDRVLNLDDDETKNFMVYNDAVKKFECTDKVNTIQSADSDKNTYVFTNADESLKNLKQDDIFVNDETHDKVLIIKVGSISVDGNTVTVTGADTSLEEVFDHVKIETKGSMADAEFDNNSGSKGITYVGSDETAHSATEKKLSDPVGAQQDTENVGAIEINQKFSYEHEFKFSNDEDGESDIEDNDSWIGAEGEIKGSIKVGLEAEVSVYLSLGEKEVKLSLTAKAFFQSTINGTIKVNPKLPDFKIPLPIGALSINVTLGFFVETSGKFETVFEAYTKVGFSYNGRDGFKNISEKPQTDYSMNLEGELFAGLSIDITLVIIDDDIGEAGFSGKVGIDTTASPTKNKIDIDGITVKHDCNRCISGDISFKIVIEPVVNVGGKDVFGSVISDDFSYETEIKVPLTSWHYSCDYDEFGLNLCPHAKCTFFAKVVDEKGNPVEGADIDDYWNGVSLGTTGSLGLLEITLKGNDSCLYQLHATKGDLTDVANIYISDFEDILDRRGTGDWCSFKDSDSFKNNCYVFTLHEKGDDDDNPPPEPPTTDPEPTTEPTESTEPTEPSSTNPSTTNPPSTEPTSTKATEPFVIDSGKCGDKLTWEFWSDGNLKIDGVGAMYNYFNVNYSEHFYYHSNIGKTMWGPDLRYNNNLTCPWGEYRDQIKDIEFSKGVTSIGSGAFYNCDNLKDLFFPLTTITSIGKGAFWGCDSLESVFLGKSITNIGVAAFYDCENLGYVDFDDANLDELDAFVFGECSNLEYFNRLPSSIEEIGTGAFYQCYSLHDIIIPKSVVRIGNGAFMHCGTYCYSDRCDECDPSWDVKDITISENVTYIGESAFLYSGARSFNVSGNNSKYASIDGVLYDKDITAIISYPGHSENLSYTIPNTVTAIDDWNFGACINLEHIIIPDNITRIGECAFRNSSIVKINIPENITYIGKGAFYGCDNLEEVELSGNSKLEFIAADLFNGCSSLKNITIPDSVSNIYEWAFHDCSKMDSLYIGKGVKSIGEGAFRGCSSLTNVTIPDSVSVIYKEAFYECPKINSLHIGNGVKTIGENAFGRNSALKVITIPPNVETIKEYAFSNYTKNLMRKVYFCGDAPTIENRAFECNTGYQSSGWVYAYYPEGNTTWTEDKLSVSGYGGIYKWLPYSLNESVGAANKITSNSVSAQSLSIDTNVSKITAEYSNKVANAYYIIAVVKDPNAEDVLSADNLIYINQYTADKDGKISTLLPAPKDVGDDYDVVIFGAEGGADVPDKPEKGDVNGDGKVTVDDVTSIQKYIADAVKFDDAQITVADVNNDGKVNIDDVTMIQKYIADMIPSL